MPLSSNNPDTEAVTRSRLRILLIDDDPDDSLIFASRLPHLSGCRIDFTSTRSFEAGLRLISTGGYDLHFIDYRLGSNSGLDLMRRALHMDPTRVCVILTAYGDESLAVKSLHAGARDYLPKAELTEQALRRCIDTCLAGTAQEPSEQGGSAIDPETGAYSCELFDQTATNQLAASLGAGTHWAMLYLEIDGFDHVAVDWGPDHGRQTVHDVVRTIRKSLADSEPVGWRSYASFCVLVSCSGRDEAFELADHLRSTIECETTATASVGIAIEPARIAELGSLLSGARVAALRAAVTGGNQVEIWVPG